jgi:hypothetical protein
MAEAINRSWTHWFEIPVSNFYRAITFYKTIYNMKIDYFEAGVLKMGISPHNRAGGGVLQTKKPISEEHGFTALFLHSEGNRFALNSMT